MAGVCLCQFQNCSKSNECKRYLDSKIANPNMASYAEFKNVCNESNNYQYFWSIKKEDEDNE